MARSAGNGHRLVQVSAARFIEAWTKVAAGSGTKGWGKGGSHVGASGLRHESIGVLHPSLMRRAQAAMETKSKSR